MGTMGTKSVTMVTTFKEKCGYNITFSLFIHVISQIICIFAYKTIKPLRL